MPLIVSGASAVVSIPKGYALLLAAGAVGTLAFGPGPAARQAPVPMVGQAVALGPYPDTQTAYVTSASGQISYSLQRVDGMIPSLVPPGPFKMSPLILEQNHVAGTALTGTTALTTLASILLPAGLLGVNGSLRISAAASITNNANTKTLQFALGGTAFLSATATASAELQQSVLIGNRGSLASQVGRQYGPSGGASVATGTVNTAIDQIITISGQLGVGTDSMTLDSYLIEVLPG